MLPGRIEGKNGGMFAEPEIKVRLLLQLKARYGDLNRALILEYVLAFGSVSIRKIAQDVGLSRSVVERALQEWPDSGH